MYPRCWAEIDLDAMRHNAATCRASARPGSAVMAIVKADAYGHGLAASVGALDEGVEGFGVANLAEAQELVTTLGKEKAGRILVLSPLLPEERSEAVTVGVAVSVSNREEVRAYAAAAKEAGKKARLHAIVDTGMGRMGAAVGDFPALIQTIRNEEAVTLDGVASHFPSADEDEAFSRQQLARFRELVEKLDLDAGVRIHLGNSAGLLRFGEELAFTNEVRPGLAIYGISPLREGPQALSPAMTWKSRVTLVREVSTGDSISYGRTFVAERPLRTATLAVGYGDGYPRSLSGAGAEVLIGGQRCSLLGRVTMDQVVVDVTSLPEEEVISGSEAVLMGSQGEETISAVELATKAGTIPWEILTGITGRVERRYRGE